MSIIHDALKKVQQSIPVKSDEAPVSASSVAPKVYNNPFDDPAPAAEILSTSIGNQKPPVKNNTQSIFTIIFIILITTAITIASIAYIFQQVQNKIPGVEKLAQKSILKLIHKKDILIGKTTPPTELKPLVQLTINSNKSPAPITLNIHGIMSEGSKNIVLVDDQVYQEGDTVDGAKISKISLNSITIISNGVEQIIPVKN